MKKEKSKENDKKSADWQRMEPVPEFPWIVSGNDDDHNEMIVCTRCGHRSHIAAKEQFLKYHESCKPNMTVHR